MNKHYTSVTTNRTPRPRSKRLREQGIGSTNSTVVLNAETGGGGTSGDGHTHLNKTTLDKIANIDGDGYEYVEHLQETTTTDPETGQQTTEYEKGLTRLRPDMLIWLMTWQKIAPPPAVSSVA